MRHLAYRCRTSPPGVFDVTTASLDDPEALPPAKEIRTSQRLSRASADPTPPHFEQFSTTAKNSELKRSGRAEVVDECFTSPPNTVVEELQRRPIRVNGRPSESGGVGVRHALS